jgi:uncharacterized protein (TIGR00369 family)
MTKFDAKDPNYEARVRDSFVRHTAMQTLGASLGRVDAGEVEVELPFRADLTQQHDIVHGGIVTAILDAACSYAVLSLIGPESSVATVEYKVNFVAPAKGDRLLARGLVVRPGGTIAVCKGDVTAFDIDEEQIVATMLATMTLVPNRLFGAE